MDLNICEIPINLSYRISALTDRFDRCLGRLQTGLLLLTLALVLGCRARFCLFMRNASILELLDQIFHTKAIGLVAFLNREFNAIELKWFLSMI